MRTLPWTIMPMFVAPIAGALSDRIGGRPLMAAGLGPAGDRAGLARVDHHRRRRLLAHHPAVHPRRHRHGARVRAGRERRDGRRPRGGAGARVGHQQHDPRDRRRARNRRAGRDLLGGGRLRRPARRSSTASCPPCTPAPACWRSARSPRCGCHESATPSSARAAVLLRAPATKGTRMQIEVHGRNLPVTPPLREYVGKRFQRLDRLFTRECTCDVELSVERNPRIAESQIAEATLLTRGHVVRARSTASRHVRRHRRRSPTVSGARWPTSPSERPTAGRATRRRRRRATAGRGDRRRPRPGGDRPS